MIWSRADVIIIKCTIYVKKKKNSWTFCLRNETHSHASPLRLFFFFQTLNFLFCIGVEKEMATHSSIPAWRIPWTEDPGVLQSRGSQRVRCGLGAEQQRSWSTVLWQLQVSSERTQPHVYMHLFSSKPRSEPGWHKTLSKVPCAMQ